METMTIKMFDYPYEIYEYNAAEYVESLENLSQALEKPFLFANTMSVDNLTYDNSPRHKTLYSLYSYLYSLVDLEDSPLNIMKEIFFEDEYCAEWNVFRNEGLTFEMYYKGVMKKEYQDIIQPQIDQYIEEIKAFWGSVYMNELAEQNARKQMKIDQLNERFSMKKVIKFCKPVGIEEMDYAHVIVQDNQTGQEFEFHCKYIYDVGKLIHPTHIQGEEVFNVSNLTEDEMQVREWLLLNESSFFKK